MPSKPKSESPQSKALPTPPQPVRPDPGRAILGGGGPPKGERGSNRGR